MSKEIGNGLFKIICKNFDSVTFKRKNKVLPLATISASKHIPSQSTRFYFSKECASLNNQTNN